jgi:hypothetical protein
MIKAAPHLKTAAAPIPGLLRERPERCCDHTGYRCFFRHCPYHLSVPAYATVGRIKVAASKAQILPIR